MKGFLCLLLLISLAGCALDPKEMDEKPYFDVSGLLETGMGSLAGQQVGLHKQVRYEDRSADTLLLLDTAAFRLELDMFREADINQPVLLGRYQADTLRENKQRIVRYVARSPENMRIDTLLVWLNGQGTASRLRARFSDRNLLYQSARELQLWFSDESQLPLRYRIDGHQHMIFQDTVYYRIEAEFQYRNEH